MEGAVSQATCNTKLATRPIEIDSLPIGYQN